LDVYVHEYIGALGQVQFDRVFRGSVILAVDLCPLQKVPELDLLLELDPGKEMVICSI